MFKYMYIDESGDLGEFGSNYFTVAGIIVDNPMILTRIIKKLRHQKLKKKIKELSEIKANNSDKRVREYVLKKVRRENCDIIAIVVEKKAIMKHLFNVKEKLYNYLCGILMKKIPVEDGKLIVTIDQKYTNTLLKEDFNNYIKKKCCQISDKVSIEIYHKLSQSSNELQVVDFIAWSINRKFNAGDDYYYNLIEDKIINKEDMRLWKN